MREAFEATGDLVLVDLEETLACQRLEGPLDNPRPARGLGRDVDRATGESGALPRADVQRERRREQAEARRQGAYGGE